MQNNTGIPMSVLCSPQPGAQILKNLKKFNENISSFPHYQLIDSIKHGCGAIQ